MLLKAKYRNVFIVLTLIAIDYGCAQKNGYILEETFDYPDGTLPDIFWSEGSEAVIADGNLMIDTDTNSYRASTVWLDKELYGNVRIDFDVKVISSSDKANNINVFFMYSDPSGKTLRDSSEERRDGAYGNYHHFNGYIFTNVAIGDEQNARYRFRENPGFHLLYERFKGENKVGIPHHITIIKERDRLQYLVDGKKIMDLVDDRFNEPYNHGLMGFRTWHTSLLIDNLTIKKLGSSLP